MSRGFQVGIKLVKVWKWVQGGRMTVGFHHKSSSTVCRRSKTVIRFCKWSRSLHQRVRVLCSVNNIPGYIRLGQEQHKLEACEKVPKGYLAVYVGESKHEKHRVIVPVKYLMHPLFGALLEETERAFGHNQAGGIQIPCPIFKFENVKMRIATSTTTQWR
ncbi:hypothetical protein QQ045_020225 [Rhodiola kirilowii]